MKRRAVKDTLSNCQLLNDLGYSYTRCEKRKRIYIKVTNSDFMIIKELLPDQLIKQGREQ